MLETYTPPYVCAPHFAFNFSEGGFANQAAAYATRRVTCGEIHAQLRQACTTKDESNVQSMEDANGNWANDSLTVTATLPDTTAPVVTITGPKPEAEFGKEAATITVSGSAADNTQVTAVNWTDDHGYSGGATLSGQTWSIAGLDLEVGPNVSDAGSF